MYGRDRRSYPVQVGRRSPYGRDPYRQGAYDERFGRARFRSGRSPGKGKAKSESLDGKEATKWVAKSDRKKEVMFDHLDLEKRLPRLGDEKTESENEHGIPHFGRIESVEDIKDATKHIALVPRDNPESVRRQPASPTRYDGMRYGYRGPLPPPGIIGGPLPPVARNAEQGSQDVRAQDKAHGRDTSETHKDNRRYEQNGGPVSNGKRRDELETEEEVAEEVVNVSDNRRQHHQPSHHPRHQQHYQRRRGGQRPHYRRQYRRGQQAPQYRHYNRRNRAAQEWYQQALNESIQRYYSQQQMYHAGLSQSLAYRLGHATANSRANRAMPLYDEAMFSLRRRPVRHAPTYPIPSDMSNDTARGTYSAGGLWFPYPTEDSYDRRRRGGESRGRHEAGAKDEDMRDASEEKEVKDVTRLEPLRKQIEYYFSDENLAKDDYLKGLMDEEGFVKARFLETFPRVRKLKASSRQIVVAIESSKTLEVKNRRIRRKEDWQEFLPSQENVSKGILEAMATKIQDHWFKVARFKKSHESEEHKETQEVSKSEEEATAEADTEADTKADTKAEKEEAPPQTLSAEAAVEEPKQATAEEVPPQQAPTRSDSDDTDDDDAEMTLID